MIEKKMKKNILIMRVAILTTFVSLVLLVTDYLFFETFLSGALSILVLTALIMNVINYKIVVRKRKKQQQ